MAATFKHIHITASHAMATLPRTFASHFIKPTLIPTTTTIFNHHLPRYPLQFSIYNFTSTYQNLHTKATNLSDTISIEEHDTDDSSSKVSDDVLSSPTVVAIEYADLNLPLNDQGIRIRQHVNPLSAVLSVPAEVPDWNDVFRDSSLPLMVDIGCGSGRYLLWLAKRNFGSNNYLGLEIRKKLVNRANFWAKELSLSNAHFMFANATISFQQLVSSYPGPLMLVSILCPDPHFKKRHHKRRVLQKPLVDSIVDNLTSSGQVFVQSDVHEVAVDMRNQFDVVSDMLHIDSIDPNVCCDHDGWLLRNPLGIRTEREIHAELEGAKIYRRLYEKSS